ncbi:hypothetical protein CPB85DRAFT_1226001 [Mucidula mucida]|nr:hypothetical protein CPB85DRAFT_1226001 [Mucidula mucida]
MSTGADAPSIHAFLMECHCISTRARFIIDTIPNADLDAAERAVTQLDTIRYLLYQLHDQIADAEQLSQTWRDIRKDCLKIFCQIFFYLERAGVLDMENPIHCLCLFLTFQSRIQASLQQAKDAWNPHKFRTERNRTPVLLYELSREQAINQGYWTGNMGDPIKVVEGNNSYGIDPSAPLPSANKMNSADDHPSMPPRESGNNWDSNCQKAGGILLNKDEELEYGRQLMQDYDFKRDDGNWGIKVYCEAVQTMTSCLE